MQSSYERCPILCSLEFLSCNTLMGNKESEMYWLIHRIKYFGDLIGRCYCCDVVAALKLSKYNPPALNAACNVKFSPSTLEK